MARTIAVDELTPGPADRDEIGTPDALIARCADCQGLIRVGSWHICPDAGERVDWPDFHGLRGGAEAYPTPVGVEEVED